MCGRTFGVFGPRRVMMNDDGTTLPPSPTNWSSNSINRGWTSDGPCLYRSREHRLSTGSG